MVAVMLEWPSGYHGFVRCSVSDFRAVMVRLCRAMQSKCFHRHYLFQALVHYETCTFPEETTSIDYWTSVFVASRQVTEEERALCDEFDDFLECQLAEDDIKFMVSASQNPLIKREKVRQLGVMVAFTRHKGYRGTFDTLVRLGLWMSWWAKLGEAHPSGPAYWCQLGDNLKHLLKTMRAWDVRHNSAHRLIKAGIRSKNQFLAGRILLNRHCFVDPRGAKVTFYATVPETRHLKRKLEEVQIVRDILEKRISVLEGLLEKERDQRCKQEEECAVLRKMFVRMVARPDDTSPFAVACRT